MHARLRAAVEGSFSMEKIGKPAPFAKRAKDAAPEKSKAKGSATRLSSWTVVPVVSTETTLPWGHKSVHNCTDPRRRCR
jgi:hypothetical protein